MGNYENDRAPITSGIKFKDKLGYALGDAGGCLTFGIVGAFLQMFYTDVLMLDAKSVMVLFVVARLWDAVNDPLWGAVVDRRKVGKGGKYLPIIRWGSIPLAIAGILLFTKIPGLSSTGLLVFAYVTYILYGMMYTVVTIPYGSLASVITTDEAERSSLSVFRSIGAGLGGLPGQVLLPLFVYSVSETTGEKTLDGTKLLIGVAVLAVISVFVYQGCASLSVERVAPDDGRTELKFKNTLKALVKNRPFIALCVASMLLLATQQYTQSLYNYLFVYYFEQSSLYSLVTIITYAPMVILLPFIGKIVRRFGKSWVCAVGMAVAFIANLVLLLIRTTNPYIFFILCFISGFGMMFLIMEVWALATDVIDLQEKLSGQREEGTAYSFFSFTRKLGQTVAGFLGTWVLSLIGYEATNVTAEVTQSIYTVSALVPAITCLIMAICLGPIYNAKMRTGSKEQQLEKEA